MIRTRDEQPYSCEEVIIEIKKQQSSKVYCLKNLLILIVSFYIFFSLGLVEKNFKSIIIIIFVLLMREIGYYIGTCLFEYRNKQALFTPFLGTDHSGQRLNITRCKKGLVVLLGSLPGIFIGIIFIIIYFNTRVPIYRQMALIFFLINGFYLLPFFPLDGGQFLEHIFFSKHMRLQLVFRLVTSVVLVICAYYTKIWLLGILGLFNFFWPRIPIQVARLADDFERSLPESDISPSEVIMYNTSDAKIIPPEIAKEIINRIWRDIPGRLNLEVVARFTWQIWERMHSQPPKPLVTFALLGIYLLSLVPPLIISMSVAAVQISNRMVEKKIAQYQKPTGEIGQKEQCYLRGKLVYENDVDTERILYHGRSISYFHDGTIKIEGNWCDGKWHGKWNHYDRQGNLMRVITMDKGKFIRCIELEDGRWVEKGLDDLPFWLRQQILRHTDNPPLGPKLSKKRLDSTEKS